jgi:hypothetical protein
LSFGTRFELGLGQERPSHWDRPGVRDQQKTMPTLLHPVFQKTTSMNDDDDVYAATTTTNNSVTHGFIYFRPDFGEQGGAVRDKVCRRAGSSQFDRSAVVADVVPAKRAADHTHIIL